MPNKLKLIKHPEKGQCDLCHQSDREVYVFNDGSEEKYCRECCYTGEGDGKAD